MTQEPSDLFHPATQGTYIQGHRLQEHTCAATVFCRTPTYSQIPPIHLPAGHSAGRVESLRTSTVLSDFPKHHRETPLTLEVKSHRCCKRRGETRGSEPLCCCLRPARSSSFGKDGWHKANVAFLWHSRACFSRLSGIYDT